MIGPALLAGACAGLAVSAYNHLSGRDFVRDNVDRVRLSRRSLSAWDEHAASNPRVADVTVCLTTTPSRIALLGPTLASLLAQEVRPRALRLHVPERSRREDRTYEIPAWLRALSTLQIVRTPDFGPATKLLPALHDVAPDQALLVVDDDKLYPACFVRRFAAAAQREPDVAWGSSGWIVPPDLLDRPTTLLSNLRMTPPVPIKGTRVRAPVRVDVLQGYSGYLVRPRFFELDALFRYDGAPEAAYYVDDVWISAHCRVPKLVLPSARYCSSVLRHARVHRATALGALNRGDGDPARRSNSVVMRHLREAWMVSGKGVSSSPERHVEASAT